MANPDDIIINVQVNGINNLTGLSNAVRTLNATLTGNLALTKNIDASQKALDTALGRTSKGVSNHAKSLSQLMTNQAALSQEYRRVNTDINNFTAQLGKTRAATNSSVQSLTRYSEALKGIKARAFVEDLRAMSVEMKRLGKDAQFTGRSMIIGITTPLVGFGRTALAELRAVDAELVRINKIIEYIAPNIEAAARKLGTTANELTAQQEVLARAMVNRFNDLDNSLIRMSQHFAISRSLILGVAGDFAELGLSTTDTIESLTRLVAEAEKLGNLDIGQSRQFVQSMYQQANRAININASLMNKVISAKERETKATAAVNAQLAMFNQIENVTALSLRDIADAFPEVSAASTSFGLSMTETAALLAPMVAAGFEVGASANSIKVSLQRLNDPTQQNQEMINKLASVMGGEFIDATHLGINSLNYLAEAFGKLSKSGYGAEGALEFMSSLFGVRQGPRMEVAIQELSQLNDALKQGVSSAEGELAAVANNIINIQNAAKQTQVPVVRTFADIGAIARIASADVGQQVEVIDKFGKTATITVSQNDINAAKAARKAVGDQILEARREGKDLVGELSTQAAKAMFTELAGAASAQEIASQELEAALDSIDVKVQKIKINFKLFAGEFIKGLTPVINLISDISDKVLEWYRNLSPVAKNIMAIGVVGLAAIGPLVFAFGQARLVMATTLNALLKFLPGLANLTSASLAASPALLRLRAGVVMVGSSMETTASRSSLLIARLASMGGPIGKLANKFGILTGALKKTVTASKEVQTAVAATSRGSIAIATAMQGTAGVGAAQGVAAARSLAVPPVPATFSKGRLQAEMARIVSRQGGTTTPLGGGRFRRTIPGAGFVSQSQLINQAKSNLGRAAAIGVSTNQLDVGEQLFARDLGLRRQGTLGSRQFRGLGTGRFASLPMSEADFRAGVGQRLQRGIARGISYETTASGAQAMFGNRALTARQEMRIARGGVAGALTRARVTGGDAISAGLGKLGKVPGLGVLQKGFDGARKSLGAFKTSVSSATGVTGKLSAATTFLTTSLKTMAISAFSAGKKMALSLIPFRASVKASQAAVAELAATNALYGQAAPGFFAKARTGIVAFGKNILSTSKMFKVLKIAMMSTGILAIVLGITAGVIFLMRNFKKLNDAGGDVKKKLGDAFKLVKDTVMAIIKPFKDFIGSLVGAAEQASGVGEGMGGIADKIKGFAEGVKEFVEKYIVPGIKFLLQNTMNVIQGIINFVKAVISVFRGKWGDALKYLLKAVGFFAKAFINIWFKIQEFAVSIMFEIGNKVVDAFAAIIATLLEGIKGIVRWIGLGGLVQDWIDRLYEVEKPFDSLKNTAVNALDAIRQGVLDVIDEKLNISTIEVKEGAGDDLLDSGEAIGRELAEVITSPAGESLDQLADQFKDVVRDLKQNFVDKILDSVNDKLGEAVDQLTSALEKQKESALAVFDTQLNALDALKKAEESLTQEQEYQANRRRMIQERELQILNYQRNRALAIYEGRIDDARILTLQEQSDNSKYVEDVAQLDLNRRKDLAQENLDNLRSSIEKTQKEAEAFYTKQIEDFQNAAKEITKFPPLTIEEYGAQLGKLNDKAKEIAGENGDVLKQMMSSMKDNLKMPNENVGIFTTGLDSLVSVAKEKYGLLDNTNENGIIGATIGMLAGIAGQFEGNRESIASSFNGIVADVFDVGLGFTNIATDIVTPTLDSIEQIFITHNPFDVFEQAIRDANIAIVREMYGTVGTIGSLVDVLASRIDESIVRLAVLRAVAAQTPTAPGGGGGTGDTTGRSGYPSSETYAGIQRQISANVNSDRNPRFGGLTDAAKSDLISRATSTILDLQLANMGKSTEAKRASYQLAVGRITETNLKLLVNDYLLGAASDESRRYGGSIRKFNYGGFNVPAFASQSVPALLHGGEYVINADAVRNIGYATLQNLNNMRFGAPSGGGQQVSTSSSTTTTNIYVENFIGQDEWFNSMIKKYNMNVLPKNQKNAGMENRVLTSYNGMTRGA